MKRLENKYWVYFGGGLLGILCLDLVTKFLAVEGTIGDQVIMRGVLYFASFQKNEGIAFGVHLPMWIQIGGGTIILFLLVFYGFDCVFKADKPSALRIILLGMIVGGGVGNLLSRIINGYVVDFIVLRPFPVFNVADIGITVGIILLFGTMILSQKIK